MIRPLTLFLCALLVAALLTVSVLALSIGQIVIPPVEAVAALFGSGDQMTRDIVTELRMPRLLTALLSGAALAVAGVVLQSLFMNPLADSWSMGLLAGGQLGAAVVIVAGSVVGSEFLSGLTVLANLGSLVGAAAGMAAVATFMLAVSRRVGTVTLLVTGLMLGFLAQGLVSVLLHFTNRTQGRIFASWNDADFAGVAPADLPELTIPVLAGFFMVLLLAKSLSTLQLGETYAVSLGVDLARLRRGVLAAILLLAAPVVAFCGPVMFIGLIAPHIARQIVGSARLSAVIPVVVLVGALLAVLGDFVVHLPWEQHWLHLNAILALVGAPVVIGILLRGGDSGSALR